jgi:hypothetical protein
MVIKGNSSWEQINQGGSSGRPTDQRKILHTQYFMNNLAKSAIYYYFMPLLFSCYFIPLFLLLISPSLGCAFCRNSGGIPTECGKRHRPFLTGTGTRMCYNTILDIPDYSGWYLSTRFLQVENACNYSKYVKLSPRVQKLDGS